MVYSSTRALEPEDVVHEDEGDTAGNDLAIDHEDLVHAAVNAVRGLGARVLQREGVLVDAAETLLQVGHDLLRPGDEDDAPGTACVRPELAATVRCRHDASGFGDRVDAAEHQIGRCGEAADLV